MLDYCFARRLLLLSSVWLLSTMGACQAAAVPTQIAQEGVMWPNCSSLVSTDFVSPPNGGDFEAHGCNFFSRVTTVNVSQLSRGTSVTITISGGRLMPSPNTGLWIQCPTETTAKTVGPMRLSIKNMIFGQDASLKLTGTVPPFSSILIANNTFVLTQHNVFAYLYNSAAIVFGNITENLFFDTGTSVTIINNTGMISQNTTGVIFLVVVGVLSKSTMTLRANASLIISGNGVTNSAAEYGYIIRFHLTTWRLTMTNHSSVRLHDNFMLSSTITSTVYIINWDFQSMSLTNRSEFSVHGNTIKDSSVGSAFVVCVMLTPSTLTITGQSLVSFVGNTICRCSVDGNANIVLVLGGRFAIISDGSAIIFNNNTADTITATHSIYLLSLTTGATTISAGSSITMIANKIRNCSFTSDAKAAFIDVENTLSIEGTSDIIITENYIERTSSPTDFGKAYTGGFNSLLNHQNSKIIVHTSSSVRISRNGQIHCNVGESAVALVSFISMKLSNSSVIIFYENIIEHTITKATTANYFTVDSVELISNSAIRFIGNRMLDSKAGVTIQTFMDVSGPQGSNLTLSRNSTIEVSHNVIHNCSVGSLITVHILFSSQPSAIFSNAMTVNDSTILVHNNSVLQLVVTGNSETWFVAKIEAKTVALTDSTLKVSSNNVETNLTNVEGLQIVCNRTLLVSNSYVIVERNRLQVGKLAVLLSLASISESQTQGLSSLVVSGNVLKGVASPLGKGCLQLGNTTRFLWISIHGNRINGIPILVSANQLSLANEGQFVISGNDIKAYGSNISLVSIDRLNLSTQSVIAIENNIVNASGKHTFKLLKAVFMSRTNKLTLVRACGNVISNVLIMSPDQFFDTFPTSFNVSRCSTPSITVSASTTVTNSTPTSITPTANKTASATENSLSLTSARPHSSSLLSVGASMSSSRTDMYENDSATACLARSKSVTKSESKSRRSRTISRKNTLSLTQSERSLSSSLSSSPIIIVKDAVRAIFPVPVPPGTSATLSIVSSSIGGVTTAVDAQVIAAIGLVFCAGKSEGRNLRALSVVALDNTCEGVLLGNTVVVALGAFFSCVAVAVARLVQVRTFNRSPVGPPPTLISACATARAPQLFLTLCSYFMSSYALCGLRVGGIGLLGFALSLLVVVSFPAVTFLFGARRLMPVTYRWQPRALSIIGSIVFQSWVLDPSIESHKLFGSVFGSYRRLSSVWALSSHLSFVAGLPMMLATESSGTCGPLFAFSTVLYFIFSLAILIALPRRTALADALHAATLLTNGFVLADATAILYDNSHTSKMYGLGTAITVLTALRLVHSVCGISMSFLAQRDIVYGVETSARSHSSRRIANDSFEFDHSIGRQPLPICNSWLLRLNTFECSSLLWPLEEQKACIERSSSPLSTALMTFAIDESLILDPDEGAPVSVKGSVSPSILSAPTKVSNTSIQTPRHFHTEVWNEPLPPPPLFLTEDELFRLELAREYGKRQIAELLSK